MDATGACPCQEPTGAVVAIVERDSDDAKGSPNAAKGPSWLDAIDAPWVVTADGIDGAVDVSGAAVLTAAAGPETTGSAKFEDDECDDDDDDDRG